MAHPTIPDVVTVQVRGLKVTIEIDAKLIDVPLRPSDLKWLEQRLKSIALTISASNSRARKDYPPDPSG